MSRLGYTSAPVDSTAAYHLDFLEYDSLIKSHEPGTEWTVFSQPGQRVLELWYRESPRHLVPAGMTGRPTEHDPPRKPGNEIVNP